MSLRSPSWVLLAVVSCLLASCASTKEYDPNVTSDFYSDLNKAADGHSITILFEDGTTMTGRNLAAHSDSTEWDSDSIPTTHFIAPTETLLRVDVSSNHWMRRVFGGMAGGTLAGLLMGVAALHYADSVTAGDGILILALGGIGFVTGTLYGAFGGSLWSGSADTYYLRTKDDVRDILRANDSLARLRQHH